MCPHAQIADLPARELLPGDVVELHVGDRVPADLRLVKLKTATLRCEQASLTGESVAVQKGTEALTDEDCELQVRTGDPTVVTSPVDQQRRRCHDVTACWSAFVHGPGAASSRHQCCLVSLHRPRTTCCLRPRRWRMAQASAS